MAQVKIQAPNGAFTGRRHMPDVYKKNAGPLSVIFYEGISEPVDEALAKDFVKHFPRFNIIPLDDVVIEVRKIEFTEDYKHGAKQYVAGMQVEFKPVFAEQMVTKGIAKYIDE